jgi:hypothetical protein
MGENPLSSDLRSKSLGAGDDYQFIGYSSMSQSNGGDPVGLIYSFALVKLLLEL